MLLCTVHVEFNDVFDHNTKNKGVPSHSKRQSSQATIVRYIVDLRKQ